jgi:hypothetical protein
MEPADYMPLLNAVPVDRSGLEMLAFVTAIAAIFAIGALVLKALNRSQAD